MPDAQQIKYELDKRNGILHIAARCTVPCITAEQLRVRPQHTAATTIRWTCWCFRRNPSFRLRHAGASIGCADESTRIWRTQDIAIHVNDPCLRATRHLAIAAAHVARDAAFFEIYKELEMAKVPVVEDFVAGSSPRGHPPIRRGLQALSPATPDCEFPDTDGKRGGRHGKNLATAMDVVLLVYIRDAAATHREGTSAC